MANCLIGLGSNLGDRSQLLQAAIDQLAQLPTTQLVRASSLRGTLAAGGPASQGEYLNAAAVIETSLSPQQLLVELQRIEASLGRERIERWGPRTVDLDLLLYNQLELNSPELTLPHPRMAFRRFVLEPAVEIAPKMVYPINGWNLFALLANLRQEQRHIAFAPAKTDLCDDESGTILLRAVAEHRLVTARFREDAMSEEDDSPQRIQEGSIAGAWICSDIWLAQDCAEWAATFNIAEQEARFYELPDAMTELGIPTLVVVWQPAATEALEALDQARREPGCGPVLWIPGVPLSRAVEEVYAAMTAMG
ncbi:2-amino-4-hydroxy-6-hydroxymethyldihydropteridine diphosphokinase [Anatilimnocola sp. NA78]|uniref:2-amino-4-hydroxy-6- hydroxymethyldihydropteridine diphosphokinase n=1 Tax=Anatilimnocola sp. NA78 TaxID=3415683 RepID=UPI003CE5C203